MYRSLIIIFLLCGCATDPWTQNQKYLQGAASVLKIIDWGQTLDISERPDQYREANPILGDYPDRSKINKYFGCSLISQILITHLLPSKYRKWWLGSNIIISGALIERNYAVGLRVNF